MRPAGSDTFVRKGARDANARSDASGSGRRHWPDRAGLGGSRDGAGPSATTRGGGRHTSPLLGRPRDPHRAGRVGIRESRGGTSTSRPLNLGSLVVTPLEGTVRRDYTNVPSRPFTAPEYHKGRGTTGAPNGGRSPVEAISRCMATSRQVQGNCHANNDGDHRRVPAMEPQPVRDRLYLSDLPVPLSQMTAGPPSLTNPASGGSLTLRTGRSRARKLAFAGLATAGPDYRVGPSAAPVPADRD